MAFRPSLLSKCSITDVSHDTKYTYAFNPLGAKLVKDRVSGQGQFLAI